MVAKELELRAALAVLAAKLDIFSARFANCPTGNIIVLATSEAKFALTLAALAVILAALAIFIAKLPITKSITVLALLNAASAIVLDVLDESKAKFACMKAEFALLNIAVTLFAAENAALPIFLASFAYTIERLAAS